MAAVVPAILRQPAASLPDLRQMPSSPTSNVQPQMTARRHDSKSSAALVWAVGELRTWMFKMETSSHKAGFKIHFADFETSRLRAKLFCSR
jgi:hypothetical protein